MRNVMFNIGLRRSVSFPIPIISVGNLTTGGTGKTPHTEYLIRLLKDNKKIATLSRGYGRKTKGFIVGKIGNSSTELGDEPLQYVYKFDDIIVTVCEDRVKGVKNIRKQYPETEVVLLDDAYQHRQIKPGLNILLMEYSEVFTQNYLLPSGTLREPSASKRRADIIIVTKSPIVLSPLERRRIESEINAGPHQKTYFSYLKYGDFMPTWSNSRPIGISQDYYYDRNFSILLVTGIATPDHLMAHMREKSSKVKLLKFADHHEYTLADLKKIEAAYEEIFSQNKIIVTTEKDYMRFKKPELEEAFSALKMFYLPIEIAFHNGDGNHFNEQVNDFVNSFKKL